METQTTETQTIVETPEDKKRRLGRERTRKHRQKYRVEEPPESFQEISAKWMDNDKRFTVSDPALHAQLLQRHQEVEELEAESDDIQKGVEAGLRAETRTLATVDSKEIFPDPCVSFRDIKAHALMNGSANYRAIEAASIKGEPLDDVSRYYEKYGFRLRIQSDILQMAREMVVLYALRTHDQNLDWDIVKEAINDCSAYNGFSRNADELRRLIRDFKEHI